MPLGSSSTSAGRSAPTGCCAITCSLLEINGDTAPGVGSGQAIATMERLAAQVLPSGMGFEWTDLAYQQILAGNVALFIFPICVLFVFLVLAAQYESWVLPLAIILIVPMCLLSAIAGVWLRGMDNILTQIGFVVLVALACKNAILIVEFAKGSKRRQRPGHGSDRGLPHPPAANPHDLLRLHPRRAPLFLATGAGAEMLRALGTSVLSGMVGVTFFGLPDAGFLRGHPLVRRTPTREARALVESCRTLWPSPWCHVCLDSCLGACWSGPITRHRRRRCPPRSPIRLRKACRRVGSRPRGGVAFRTKVESAGRVGAGQQSRPACGDGSDPRGSGPAFETTFDRYPTVTSQASLRDSG